MSKVWLVTGSASGLGRNIAEAVLASGDRLVATARDPRRLEDLVKKYGAQVRTAPLDVADEDAAKAAVQVAVEAFGRLDVVVNNAGYGDVAPFEQLSAERFKAVIDTNFYGVVNVTRAAIPIMRKQRSGCILQISSVGGRLAVPGSTPYHAAKWATVRTAAWPVRQLTPGPTGVFMPGVASLYRLAHSSGKNWSLMHLKRTRISRWNSAHAMHVMCCFGQICSAVRYITELKGHCVAPWSVFLGPHETRVVTACIGFRLFHDANR